MRATSGECHALHPLHRGSRFTQAQLLTHQQPPFAAPPSLQLRDDQAWQVALPAVVAMLFAVAALGKCMHACACARITRFVHTFVRLAWWHVQVCGRQAQCLG